MFLTLCSEFPMMPHHTHGKKQSSPHHPETSPYWSTSSSPASAPSPTSLGNPGLFMDFQTPQTLHLHFLEHSPLHPGMASSAFLISFRYLFKGHHLTKSFPTFKVTTLALSG